MGPVTFTGSIFFLPFAKITCIILKQFRKYRKEAMPMIALFIMLLAAFPVVDVALAVLVVGLIVKLFKWVFSSKKK